MEILEIIWRVLFPDTAEMTLALFGLDGLMGGIFNLFSTESTNKTNYEVANHTNNANLRIAQETNKANRELAEMQNKWNYDMWNEQNAYNSPSNQIELLKKAGLNPNLYANDGATAGSLTSADLANQQIGNPMVAPSMQAPQIDLAGVASMAQARTNKDKSKSEIAANYAKAGLDQQQVQNLIQQGDVMMQEIKNKQQQILESQSTVALKKAQENLAKSQGNYYDEMSLTQDSIRKNLNWQNLGIESQMKVNEKYITLMGSQFSVNKALANLHNATADKLSVDKSVSYQTIENMKQQLQNLVQEGEVLGKTVEIEGVKLRIMQSEEGLVYLQNENAAAVETAKHDPINLYPAMSAFMSLFGQVFGPAALVGSKFVK